MGMKLHVRNLHLLECVQMSTTPAHTHTHTHTHTHEVAAAGEPRRCNNKINERLPEMLNWMTPGHNSTTSMRRWLHTASTTSPQTDLHSLYVVVPTYKTQA